MYKLIKTSTHRDTVVLSNNEFHSLKQVGSTLTVVITQQIDGVWHKITEIEADIPYALNNYKEGYGYYNGKKIVSVRPVQSVKSVKSTRKPRVKNQFCKRGHDVSIVGRNRISGACNQCIKLRNNIHTLETRLATAKRKLIKPDNIQGLNPDEPSND